MYKGEEFPNTFGSSNSYIGEIRKTSGSISFGLMVIIGIMSIAFVAYIYNSMTKRKKW